MGWLSRPALPAHRSRPAHMIGGLLAAAAVSVVCGAADARGADAPQQIGPFVQQGGQLHDGENGKSFGASVAVSSDGSTAVVGSPGAEEGVGAAWVFSRSATGWVQEARLSGSGESGTGQFGASVALSADGGTVLVGAPYGAGAAGGVWVFTHSGGGWSQQGPELSRSEEIGPGQFGSSVALSADGNTALVGGWLDNNEVGAAWVFTRSGESWAQQGPKLVGSGTCGLPTMGNAVALSADGNTALVAGFFDCDKGAVWTFARSGSTWSQQGSKLRASGEIGKGFFGSSIGLSADGETAVIGANEDNGNAGAAWAFRRSGASWVQQGGKLTGGGERGTGYFGSSIGLSADGSTALIGGMRETTGFDGSAWVFAHSGSTWGQQGGRLTGSGEGSEALQLFGGGGFGRSVALSGNGALALVGGGHTSGLVGGVWTFVDETGASPPAAQFGRCVQIAKVPGVSTGSYKTAGCLALGGKHEYEWFAGPASTHFKLASQPGGAVALQTSKGTRLSCLALTGAGEFTGNALSTVGNLGLTLSGCELSGSKCASAGAASGEVLTAPLEGALGITKTGNKSAKNGIGLSIHPAGAGGSVAQFTCASSSVSIRGSVVGSITTNKMLSALPLSFSSAKGKQKPEGFIGQPASTLEVSLGGAAYEPAVLAVKASLVGEGPLEVDPAFSEACSPSPKRQTGRAHKPAHKAVRVRHGKQCLSTATHKPARKPARKTHKHS